MKEILYNESGRTKPHQNAPLARETSTIRLPMQRFMSKASRRVKSCTDTWALRLPFSSFSVGCFRPLEVFWCYHHFTDAERLAPPSPLTVREEGTRAVHIQIGPHTVVTMRRRLDRSTRRLAVAHSTATPPHPLPL
jgi:hypothetical protein